MTYRMSITRLRDALPPIALLALLAGCAADSGPPRTESRSIGNFHAIELRGAAQMDVEVGKGPGLSITGSEQVLQATGTEVRDGVLVVQVRERRWFQRGPAARISVQAPTLDAVNINGAGDFNLHDVTGEKLDISVQGAGSIEANGTIGRLTAHIDGAGSADLSRLAATDADVAVNGAGSLDLQVSGTLNAEVNGVGSITYAGNPQRVVPTLHGVGSISPAGGKK